MRPTGLRILSIVFPCAAFVACSSDTRSSPSPTSPTDETPTYTSQAPASSHGSRGEGVTIDGTSAPAPQSAGGGFGAKSATAPAPGAPGGRVADVEEADVYRIRDGKLYLLNTYRGFLIYDISNSKQPTRLSHLPVYGYPVEMFVEGTTIYALLSDVLDLKQIGGKLQFERRQSSQIVTVDIGDPANPKLLQAYDLAGQLREGVSRKIENSIYVVSYQPKNYWYFGWGPRTVQEPNEQAWVYSFDASTPSNLKQVGKLKVFEGGSTNSYDPTTGESHSRYSNGVTLSATSNAIMVVQNWYTSDYVPTIVKDPSGGASSYGCSDSRSDQDSVVSVVDVSDPSGTIRVAATFATPGALTDQFKQTYVYDAAAKTGTYLGIFARNMWSGSDCNWTQSTRNTLLAWDITGNGSATRLSSVDFGKPDETVRGSYFDVDRKVAFAITARTMDPMYAISFADRNNLKILSAIDGLSGDMDLFRPVENGQYLLAVGRDTGEACAGYVGGTGGKDAGDGRTRAWTSEISVSLIDVRDLAKIRLVQRKCLDIANAGWVSSQVTWNLDQAHKMIGLHTNGTSSVLTVPVSYSVEDTSNGNDWYWYRYETAVGIMSWDIARYDSSLPPERQDVISTHGHFVHPSGEVNRSALFGQGADQHREMLNISDTHLSFANLQDLDHPVLDSVVEIAKMQSAVYRFGDYVVEQAMLPSADYSQTAYKFQVKKSGGDLEGTPVAASFIVGQVQQVLRHGDRMVFFRLLRRQTSGAPGGYPGYEYVPRVSIYDLSVPTAPKPLATVDLPDYVSPYGHYYRYYWGGMGYFGGYYFGYDQTVATVDEGIAFLIQTGAYVSQQVPNGDRGTITQSVWVPQMNLVFLDLRHPAQPTFSKTAVDLPTIKGGVVESATLVPDGMASSGFYISYRVRIGTSVDPETQATLSTYANYAQRWQRQGGAWQTDAAVNIPGTLTRTWAGADGTRLLLTRDDVYGSRKVDNHWQWTDTVTLKLLRATSVGDRPVAQMLDSKTFADAWPKSLVYDGHRIYAAVSDSPQWYGYYVMDGPVGGVVTSSGSSRDGTSGSAGAGTTTPEDTSDRLVIIDTSALTLAASYDQPTKLDNLDLMGVAQNKLFVNLEGDGVLVVDVTLAAAPKGVSFSRTLGWTSGIEFAGTSAYVSAGYYGVYRLDLSAAGNL